MYVVCFKEKKLREWGTFVILALPVFLDFFSALVTGCLELSAFWQFLHGWVTKIKFFIVRPQKQDGERPMLTWTFLFWKG